MLMNQKEYFNVIANIKTELGVHNIAQQPVPIKSFFFYTTILEKS